MELDTALIFLLDTAGNSYSQPKLQPPIPRPKRRRQNAARERKLIHLPSMQLREAFSYSFASLESDAGGRAVPKRVEKGPVLNNELFIAFSSISAKPVGVGAAFQRWILAGGTIFVADAHRDDGKRFVVRADEKLTAFVELESAIRGHLRKRNECFSHEITVNRCID